MTEGQCLNYLIARIIADREKTDVESVLEDARLFFLSRGRKTEKGNPAPTEQEIDRIYNLYPTKCPKTGRSLYKGSKDRDHIARLIQVYGTDELERRIIAYRKDCERQGQYMKNFSTFLNNLPEDTSEQPLLLDQTGVFGPQ